MKKTIYLLLAVTVIFTACQKEEGCTDTRATNFSSNAEEDDGSCNYSIAGGEWITQSIGSNGTMTVSMGGFPVLDSAISYLETNPDSLEPYKLAFSDNNTYIEYDQSNQEVEGGTWSLSGDQLTINTPDTTYVGTLDNVNKTEATIIFQWIESSSDGGFEFDVNLTQTLYLNRDY